MREAINHAANALTRRRRAYGERELLFAAAGPSSDLAVMLDKLAPTQTATLIITSRTPDTAWWMTPLAHGWALERWHSHKSARSARYTLRMGDGGNRDAIRAIDVRMATPWFGEHDYSPDHVRAAWEELQSRLRVEFGDVYLRATPGRTGAELFEASLPFGQEFPIVDEDLRADIRAWIGQGRKEVFNPERTEPLPSLTCYDARWQYAACLRGLPNGSVTDDDTNEYGGYTPGFYLVTARVPTDWRWAGLLPVRRDDGPVSHWDWPSKPGYKFVSWASSAEIGQANEHGWIERIHRRILWHGKADPARNWITKLTALRARAQVNDWNPVDELIAYATRHLVIDAVGYFSRSDRMETGILPRSRQIEIPAGALITLKGDFIEWKRAAALDKRDAIYDHPEWPATVWGRSRARLNTGLLCFELADLVAPRTDAIWACGEPLAPLPDDGKPGGWRIKASYHGPIVAPQNEAEFLAMMRHLGEEE